MVCHIIVMLVQLSVAVKKTNIHPNTLRKYADKGDIKSVRMSERGKTLFDIALLFVCRL